MRSQAFQNDNPTEHPPQSHRLSKWLLCYLHKKVSQVTLDLFSPGTYLRVVSPGRVHRCKHQKLAVRIAEGEDDEIL